MIRDHLNRTRDTTRLPNRETDRPVRVGAAFVQKIQAKAGQTYQLQAARPGRIPRSATLAYGPPGTVRVVGELVFYDAQEDGEAVLEVIY